MLEGVFEEMGVHLRTGFPLLPPASTVAPAGSGALRVPNESLIPVTESRRDPAVLQQVGPGPWGQDAAKRASSFRPESAGWGRECRRSGASRG